jgi:hypothetical protein
MRSKDKARQARDISQVGKFRYDKSAAISGGMSENRHVPFPVHRVHCRQRFDRRNAHAATRVEHKAVVAVADAYQHGAGVRAHTEVPRRAAVGGRSEEESKNKTTMRRLRTTISPTFVHEKSFKDVRPKIILLMVRNQMIRCNECY